MTCLPRTQSTWAEVVSLMAYSSIYMEKSWRVAIIALPLVNNLEGTFLTTEIEREGSEGDKK